MRYRSTSGVALNQDADTANLLAPDGSVVDSFSYTNPRRDVSYSRAIDGVGDWTETYPPSPDGPNLPEIPTPAARQQLPRPKHPRPRTHLDLDDNAVTYEHGP